MSLLIAKKYLEKLGKANRIITFTVSTATVSLAALALGVNEGQIAKTLAFQNGLQAMVIITAGDVKIDNAKFKAEFGFKARMLNPEETLFYTNHEVGGVCPFGMKTETAIYLDQSLLAYEVIYPACGDAASAVKLTPEELSQMIPYRKWIDVCKPKEKNNESFQQAN